MVAQQTISRPPLLVAQMTEEWLNYYRKIAQVRGKAKIMRSLYQSFLFLVSKQKLGSLPFYFSLKNKYSYRDLQCSFT
jgi:hypothetical protein